MSFKQIQDQEVAIRLLRGIVRRKRMPNGLLFWGPGGVGKRMAAHEFAKALNCGKQPDDACDECLSCRKLTMATIPTCTSVHGKARIIKLKSSKKSMRARFTGLLSEVRVVIIEDADRMMERTKTIS